MWVDGWVGGCLRVCVCVCEREREREREKKTDWSILSPLVRSVMLCEPGRAGDLRCALKRLQLGCPLWARQLLISFLTLEGPRLGCV